MKILIDFLGEFLLFLSSITECQQTDKIVDIAEHIHQLRSTLLIQINHDLKNSSIFDIRSICLILHELASFLRSLCKEQQQQHFGAITEHPHITTLTQLLGRVEKMIKSCMNCISTNSDPQVGQHFLCVHYKCIAF